MGAAVGRGRDADRARGTGGLIVEAWEREELDHLFNVEGGWVDDPDDHGGPTHRGVTIPTLVEYMRLKRPAGKPTDPLWQWWLNAYPDLKDRLRALSEDQTRELYLELFIRRPRFNEIPYPKVRSLVIDAGVHSHPTTAARMLQRACKVADDGVVGAITLFTVARRDPTALYCDVCAERAEFYGRLITNEPNQAKFAAGWMNRLGGFLRRAV